MISHKIARKWLNKYTTPQRALVAAAREGHLKELTALVKVNIDPTWNDHQALKMAIYNRHKQIISYLLDLPIFVENIGPEIKNQLLIDLILECNCDTFELVISKINYDFDELIEYNNPNRIMPSRKIYPLRLVRLRIIYCSELIESLINNTEYNSNTQETFLQTLYDSISNEDKNITNILLEYRRLRHLFYQQIQLDLNAHYKCLITLQLLLFMGRDDLLNFLKN